MVCNPITGHFEWAFSIMRRYVILILILNTIIPSFQITWFIEFMNEIDSYPLLIISIMSHPTLAQLSGLPCIFHHCMYSANLTSTSPRLFRINLFSSVGCIKLLALLAYDLWKKWFRVKLMRWSFGTPICILGPYIHYNIKWQAVEITFCVILLRFCALLGMHLLKVVT